MTEDHSVLREQLGAYALGHLTGDEAAAVERHVAGCASCVADLAEVAPLATRLRAVDWHRVAAASQPDAALGDRIVDAVRTERRARAASDLRQRAGAALAAAAAVVAVCGVGVVAGRGSAPRVAAAPQGPFEPVAVRAAVPGIAASAGVVPHTWGVEIKLKAAGFAKGAPYAVYVTPADGRRRTAGAFVGTGATTMTCNLNSDVLRPDAAAFAVEDAAGRVVLSATLPRAG